MEQLQEIKGFFISLVDALDTPGILADFESMDREQMEWLERMDGDASEFKKPVQRFRKKKSTMHDSIVHGDKENSLMPAPKGRAPRNRNRSTKSTINPKPPRATLVTRSSKMSDIGKFDLDVESEPAVRRSRRTRQINKESVCPVIQASADISSVTLSETEISINSCAKSSRRTTRKRTTTTVPRTSKVTRASTRTSYKCRLSGLGARKPSVGRELRSNKASVVHVSPNTPESRMTRSRIANETIIISVNSDVEEVKEIKRVTRNKAATANENENWNVLDIRKDAVIKSPELQLTPRGQNLVKQRVKAIEGLINSNKLKDGECASRPGSPYIGSPAPKKAKAIFHSPLIKSMMNKDENESKNPLASSLKDCALMEEEEEDLVNKTYEVVKSKGKKKKGKDASTAAEQEIMNFDEVLDADDEWVSDEEEDSASCKKEKSVTPKRTKKAAEAKAPVLSTKALRSRNAQKISTEVSITSGNKNKPENDVKEAELKKKMEKEEEARKRKEEIMKKRAETMKKKREEKMAKVKRTREEMEKDMKGIKAKKGRGKKAQVVEEEVPLKNTPLKPVVLKSTPLKAIPTVTNATFSVNDQEEAHAVHSYDLTPCWQDVPPVQPDNPDDYGVADKSGCSSEEENDPRKKVPDWAKIGTNDPSLLSQALLTSEWLSSYWHSRPRKPRIPELFDQVSKRTLKRGLNYRTSSACWNTPPAKNRAN